MVSSLEAYKFLHHVVKYSVPQLSLRAVGAAVGNPEKPRCLEEIQGLFKAEQQELDHVVNVGSPNALKTLRELVHRCSLVQVLERGGRADGLFFVI